MKRILILIPLFLVNYSNNMTCKRLSYQRLVSTCLDNIIRNQFKAEQAALVTIVVGQNLESPIGEILDIIINKIQAVSEWFFFATISQKLILDDYNNIRQKYRTEFYLVMLDDTFEVDEVLKNIKGIQTFNPYAICLIFIETDSGEKENLVKNILNKFSKARFLSTAVLVHEDQDLFKLYTFNYTTVNDEACEAHPTLNVMDHCLKGKMMANSKIYFKKQDISDFSNCSVNVVAKLSPPFVISKKEGFEIELLKIIGENLNITFNINVYSKKRWGKKVNGSFVGLFKTVYEKRYLGIGNIGVVTISDNQLEFSYNYHVEPLIMVVPAASDIPRWRILTVIFTTEMWGVCVATIILFGLTFYLSRKLEKGSSKNPFLTSFQTSITQPVKTVPNTDLNRVFFVALSVLSIILSSAYTCTLIKNLKNTVKEHQISTRREIIHLSLSMNYKYGGLSSYREQLTFASEKLKIIYQNYEVASDENDTVEYWINEVAERRALWTFSSQHYVKYLLAIDSNVTADKFGRPKVHVINEQSSLYPLGIVARKGHFMIKPINAVVNNMLVSGLVDFVWRKYKIRILQGESDDLHEDTVPSEALSLLHLEGAFAILLFGYGFGLFTLAIEVFVKRLHLSEKIIIIKNRLLRKILKR